MVHFCLTWTQTWPQSLSPPAGCEGVKHWHCTAPLPGGECYPRAHGVAGRVRPAALGVYSLQKSDASDIGYPLPQLRRRFRGASPSDPRARWQARRFQRLEAGTERHPARDSCLPESIQRTFWIDIELRKKNLQCIDESIFLPTSIVDFILLSSNSALLICQHT